MNISRATSAKEIAAVRQLFEEYAGSLEVDLSYQGFTSEVAGLPGAYAPPHGRLLLATDEGISAGCVALRPIDSKTCEMKRLFVRPERQGLGLGRMLAARVIIEARTIGYATILLDTLPSMQSALRLYEKLGFVRRPAYFRTPIEGNVFMELRLEDVETQSDAPPLTTLKAELAVGEGPGRIYIVEPTGPIMDDPNLTDKKFPGNPTKSYRSREPLRVTSEVTDWQGIRPKRSKP